MTVLWGVDFLKLINKHILSDEVSRAGWGGELSPDEPMELSSHSHPGVELRANLKSISHRYHLFEVAFVRVLTKEIIVVPLGCLQGGPQTIHLPMDCLQGSSVPLGFGSPRKFPSPKFHK